MNNLRNIEKIYILGSITRDEISVIKTSFSEHFDRDTTTELNFTASINAEYSYLGGTGLNIACNLGQFCDKNMYLFSVVGNDNADIFSCLSKNSINADFVSVNSKYPTSKAKGIIDKDQNHIWLIEDFVAKEEYLRLPAAVNNKNTLAIIAPVRKTIFMQFLKWAIENEIKYIFDPGMLLASLTKEELVRGIQSSAWLIANSIEMENLLSKIDLTLNELRNLGIEIILTRGANGVTYYNKENSYIVPVFKPKKIIDTSGAGDAWRGAFWSSLIAGNNLEYSLKIANSWSSFSVEKHGAIDHYPNMEKVRARANL